MVREVSVGTAVVVVMTEVMILVTWVSVSVCLGGLQPLKILANISRKPSRNDALLTYPPPLHRVDNWCLVDWVLLIQNLSLNPSNTIVNSIKHA